MMLLFYEKAIVESENWMSQSMYYFSKRSIVSRFPKTKGAVHDRDIAGEKLSGFPTPQIICESAKPLHDTTNKIYGGKE